MKAVELKTEYLRNPLAIDIKSPKLSWRATEGIRQTAYQITAYIDGMEVYDTGKVEDSRIYHRYRGDLKSRNKVIWKVRLWDEADTCGEWSEEAYFEMGLLDEKDWKAKWIDPEPEHDKETRQPASYLKKEFFVKNIGEARLYVTAHGVYDAYINGRKAGHFILAPGTSQYNERLQYQTYNVSHLLKQGMNEIVISAGDGW